jgi:hypothetical protein
MRQGGDFGMSESHDAMSDRRRPGGLVSVSGMLQDLP